MVWPFRRLARNSGDPPGAKRQASQQPFSLVAPLLRAALLLGAGAGFALASVLSVSLALALPLGPWWDALAQAHGRLQLYGWAGLFVFGVAFHFLPRLRGAPLRWPWAVPWLLGAQVAGLLLRGLSQPLLALAPGTLIWQIALVASGALEAIGLGLGVALLVGAAAQPHAPALRTRQALWGIFPFLICVASSLALGALINLADVILAVNGGGVMPAAGDDATVTLGLLGFLTPMALAMSARALPLYAGLESLSRRILWPTAFVYSAGLALTLVGVLGEPGGPWTSATALRFGGLGMALLGLTLSGFVALVARLMGSRGRLPERVRALAPKPEQAARAYTRYVSDERVRFGPYVALIGSAYVWALAGGLLLLLDGVVVALGGLPPVTLDAARHSLAVGFIALLLAGVSVRMIPGFSGSAIASPRLVAALLWLGNGAALLRVGALLLLPLLAQLGVGGLTLDAMLFGLSGPVGLAFAICLAITLWPALAPPPATVTRAE